MKAKRVVWAMCGSFCTFEKTLGVMEAMVRSGVEVLPLMSFNAAGLDTRFGTAESWKKKVEAVTGRKPIETLQGAEPLGPQNMADAMVIAPCTGATLAKLAAGISDTPVTLGAKSMLRGAQPLVLAVSTNDGLAASAPNLGQLMARKYIYLVPFRQDDPEEKPASLVADFSLVADAAQAALEGRQLQPVLLGPAAP